ncbi:protein involved in gliding motility GldB [Aquimarina amphilecti]|uniref:Protein involved in gliding motility GldB n=1 Tax=Aquimarina amphilecti TaxID=1038014 RepID=A0A1H7MK52_AQUAM|nr:gliding motility lipoprotein GldB [Aquimarina amphilecti]SEL11690.1 protein involved in gliding motility GldB [Aquimarina amphilecti]
MKYSKFLKIVVIFCIIYSCAKENKIEKEVAAIPVEIGIERFDRVFADVTPENLADVKTQYPFLFPGQYSDSIWIQKTRDTLQLEINQEVEKKFSNFSNEKEELKSLLQHIKYYFPEVTVPRVITVTSNVDYQRKVILSDNLLIISLDTYLGSDHHFYAGIQAYLKDRFVRSQILPDVATIYARQLVEFPRSRTFLANMIYYGKEMYLKDLFLPEFPNSEKMAYKDDQFAWIEANEEEIWRYFIDRQLLYSTEADLLPRFLYPGPFSKFYLEEIDQEAPDRVGQYIGWKIVSAYMKNNNVSLRQLLLTDAETIFNASKYKPSR